MFDRILNTHDDTIRYEQSQQKRHEYHLVKQERKVDGHILFSYNTVTGEVKQANVVFCKDIDFVTLQPLHKPKVVIERKLRISPSTE